MCNEIVKKYNGKKLTTDEVAEARNAIDKLIQELEGIDYETGPDSLLLKWGTLKAWDYSKNPKGIALLTEYGSIGSSASAMMQEDTERQKEILCELIDITDGVIQGDWTGEYFTKEDAKKYVMRYDSND